MDGCMMEKQKKTDGEMQRGIYCWETECATHGEGER